MCFFPLTMENVKTTEISSPDPVSPAGAPLPVGVKAVVKASTMKKNILERPGVLDLLEQAYKLGFSDAQAALHASVGLTALSDHLKAGTLVKVGEEQFSLSELKKKWKGHMGILAKRKIYKQLSNDNDASTQDAWRYLERSEPEEYGLKPGARGVDNGAKVDISVEVEKRLDKYAGVGFLPMPNVDASSVPDYSQGSPGTPDGGSQDVPAASSPA